MISFALSDDDKGLRDMAHDFADTRLRPAARDCERAGAVPAALQNEYHDLGLDVLALPENAGGAGLGNVSLAIVQEELGWGDAGMLHAMPGPGLFGYLVMATAAAETQERLLGRYAQGLAHAAVAVGEPGPGYSGELVETTAVPDGDSYRLHGHKRIVLGAEGADQYLVAARTPQDGESAMSLFVVAAGTDGLKLGARHRTLGLEAAAFHSLDLDGVLIPGDALVAGGLTPAQLELVQGRADLVLAAEALGVARAAVEYASSYAATRKAFGQLIAAFQGVSFYLADMATQLEAARGLLWQAAWSLDQGQDVSYLLPAAVLQAYEAALFATNGAVQLLGGHGYVQDHPVEKWMRDVRALTLLGGHRDRLTWAAGMAAAGLASAGVKS